MGDYLFAIIINGVIIVGWLVLVMNDKKKGFSALSIGVKTILDMLPLIIMIIGALGVFSSFIDQSKISEYLGDRGGMAGFFFISVVSSFMQIPGIIAFPIAATLRESGATIATTAVFASASTMASIMTLPLEIKYLGKTLPFIRITVTYFLCVVVGLLTGLIMNRLI